MSQEDQPGTHKSQREISRDLNVSRRPTSVHRMTKELNLKPFKRIRVSRRDQKVKQKRKTRSKNLNDNRQNDRVFGACKKEIIPTLSRNKISIYQKGYGVGGGIVEW